MKTQRSTFVPSARSEGIITKQVSGELLIYDRGRDRAHCLNATAALIWQRCDGRLTVPEIARSCSESMSAAVDEHVVHLALKQLSRNQLLTERYKGTNMRVDLSRRALIRRLGVGVVLLPVITSITAPTAMAAVSCGGSCTGGPGRGTCSPGCVCSVITNTCVT